MRPFVLLLALASSAAAGFLPLIHDRPKRDNPFDPAVQPLAVPTWVVPTATITPTPVPGCGGADSAAAFATFESGTDGFAQDTCCANFVSFSPAVSSSPVCKGGQAFCGSATVTHAGTFKQLVFKKSFGTPQNWSGKTLTAWTYASAGFDLASVQIYLKSNGYVYCNGPITHPPSAGGWALAVFDLAQAPNYSAGLTDTAQVQEVGLQLYSNATDPDGTLTFCVDDFDVQ
jgi:hypothetical protein